MALDLTNVSKITYDDLLEDAYTDKTLKRARFLEDISSTTAPRKNKKTGETEEAPISLMAVRSEYLKEFYDYKPAPKKMSTFEARRIKLDALFAKMKAEKTK